jgi:hypothetical protein
MKYKGYEIYLADDGTLDTVINIDGIDIHFDCEYASQYRTLDGKMKIKGLKLLVDEIIKEM